MGGHKKHEAKPPPALRPAEAEAKATKAQMLGFEAPVKVSKGAEARRSLVGGSWSSFSQQLSGNMQGSAIDAQKSSIHYTNRR